VLHLISVMGKSTGLPVFPRTFVFGAAASAYQIEGGWNADGKGPSIWDEFSHRKGRIKTGENADVACDHYSLWKQDVDIMRELGLRAYRGSISWPRVMPEGHGRVNRSGLDFYSRLTDALLSSGIEPYYTLFHWDLPLALQRAGGFRKRDAALHFADFAETVARALGDRVRRWITVNEPWEFACLGHFLGSHAPGIVSPRAFFSVMHNVLLAHGLAAERIRALFPKSEIGITLSYTPVFPAASGRRHEWSARIANEFMNHITLSPILKGKYPELLKRRAGILFPRVTREDMAVISRPLDFIGINYYSRERATYRWYVPLLHTWVSGKDSGDGESVKNGVQRTAMGWEVWPEGFDHVLGILRSEYGNPPVYITENGAAFADTLTDGKIHDDKRIAFLSVNLSALKRSMDAGSDIRGYFVWSLMDNFEWAEGTRPRFGIVHVDFKTLKRTIKDSGYWYRDLIAETGRS
jgi:beta-glucosidase